MTSPKDTKMLSSLFIKRRLYIWVSILSHWDLFGETSPQDPNKDQHFIWGRNVYIVWQLVSSLWLNITSLGELMISQGYWFQVRQLCLLKFIFSVESAYVFLDFFFWPLHFCVQYLSLNTLNKTCLMIFFMHHAILSLQIDSYYVFTKNVNS